MRNIGHYAVWLGFSVGLLLLQTTGVGWIYMNISNEWLSTFPINWLVTFVYNVPVFIAFFIYFFVFGRVNQSNYIGFWLLILVFILGVVATTDCEAEKIVDYLLGCFFIKISIIGSAWGGFYLGNTWTKVKGK